MQLASLSFLYLFLPASLAVYYLFPRRMRYGVLLAVSLAFFLLNDPVSLLFLSVSVTVDYTLGLLMERFEQQNRRRRAIMLVMVSKNLLLFFGVSCYCQLHGMETPLGLSVCTLLGTGYAVDIYNGEALYEHNWGKFLLAHTLFMKLPAGPLVRYRTLREQFLPKKADLARMSEPIALFIQGVAKQAILGSPIRQLYDTLSSFSRADHSVFSLWLMPLCAAMSLYFTLSGYCDMARGLGGMFGISLPRNFYYPYQSRSITDFVGRFNISVTDYLKTYIYHPLGEDSGGFASSALNIGVVTLLWGIWFGFRINYLLWGAFFVLLILLERSVWGKILMKLPVFFLRVYTFSLVLFSFVIFNGRSVGQSLFFFQGMLGLGGLPMATSPILYLLSQYAPYLVLAVLFSTSLPHSLKGALRKKSPAAASAVGMVFYGGLLFLSTGFLLHP
ncbi:MAG: MBOAT family O-acyltransferase [Oscillospiraceae bacterium]